MRRTLLGSLLVSVAIHAGAQGTIYVAGDGTTTTPRGAPICGSATADMNVTDGVSYSTASASGFAAFAPRLEASVPNPMGRDTAAATAGRWGVTVLNPGPQPLNVTAVSIDCGGANLFGPVAGVSPGTGWTVTSFNVVAWSGSLDVPAHSALDFVVRIQGRGLNRTSVGLTLSATTSAGVLTLPGRVTSQGSGNTVPYVSLPLVIGGSEVFSGTIATGGAVLPAQTATFTVRLRESEVGATVGIPAGSTLVVRVPPGWSGVSAPGAAGFGAAAVTQPTPCTEGTITAQTTAAILASARDFSWTAISPAAQGSVGLYTFRAELGNAAASPPIDTRTGFTQVVLTAPSSAVRGGLTAAAAYVSVPKPQGNNRNSVWGAALANPTGAPIVVTRVEFESPLGTALFKRVSAVRPAAGWSIVNTDLVRWTGSLTVPPHEALDFFVLIQANARNSYNQPVRITIFDDLGNAYVNTDGSTSQNGGLPSASLYYEVLGQASLYSSGLASGQARQFQVTIDEKQGVNIPASSELRIAIPRGWSAVTATTQPGFTPPSVVQPTALVDGEVRTTVATAFRSGKRSFFFGATAPPDLLESLFVLPTTLGGGNLGSLCQMVVQVVDSSGGLEVVHLSPAISDPVVHQVDVQVVATSDPPETYRLELYDFLTGTWNTLATGDVGATPTLLGGAVTAGFPAYFDLSGSLQARLTSTGRENHRIDEDYAAFVISNYRVVPSSIAPASVPQGRARVPMLGLGFEVQLGSLSVETITLEALAPDVAGEIALLRLYRDLDCNGYIELSDPELAMATPPDPAGQVTFGTPGVPLFTFDDQTPLCAIAALDLAPGATVGDLVGLRIPTGTSITSDLGPYSFPCNLGYPIRSTDVLVTDVDTDGDGLTDAEEVPVTTDPLDADSDDDGLLDGVELGGDATYEAGADTDPRQPDTDGDGLWDGLEAGSAALLSLADTDGDFTPDVIDPDPADPAIRSTDVRWFRADLDPATTSDPLDDDSDDDGVLDGNEDSDRNGRLDVELGNSSGPGIGETDPLARDTDADGIADGVELGLTLPQGTGTSPLLFAPDADPATTTSPIDSDTEDDGIRDGVEDTDKDGARDAGELDPVDADTDDDGILDGIEVGPDGVQGPSETSALERDSDLDLILDGTERGVTTLVADPDGPGPLLGTDPALFVPDADPLSTTDPLDDDSDDDGLLEGNEDADRNGRADRTLATAGVPGSGETDAAGNDTDGDGLLDGTEMGLPGPQGTGTNMAFFRRDLDPTSRTSPLDDDSDDDGIQDGVEDQNRNGHADTILASPGVPGTGETDATRADTDQDGLVDGTELGLATPQASGTDPAVFRPDTDPATLTSPLDDDSDDDGLLDSIEDGDQDGGWDGLLAAPGRSGSGETDPTRTDTDGDGIQDGTELGLGFAQGSGSEPAIFRPDLDPMTTTLALDEDADDDGLLDGAEDADRNGRRDGFVAAPGMPGSGETDASRADTDGDGLLDGQEMGLAAPQGGASDPGVFQPDLDPATRTSPLDDDGDDDGVPDGTEDADRNGRWDGLLAAPGRIGAGETDAAQTDTDGDGLADGLELGLSAPAAVGTDLTRFRADLDPVSTTRPLDDDSDEDGLMDGMEDSNWNGRRDATIGGSGTFGSGEVDPATLDTDGDGCQDGTELGLVTPQGAGTDSSVFAPDTRPSTTTSPLDVDSDDDGLLDGEEDANCNGAIDPGETDPTGGSAVLRNDAVDSLAGARALLAGLFQGAGGNSLVLAGPNGIPDPGEGSDPTRNGSDDDDDLYDMNVTRPWSDPDAATLGDLRRPLVFYQNEGGGNALKALKSAGTVALSW